MPTCQCIKPDGKQCTREASTKPDQNHIFCWQHQNCTKLAGASLPPLPTPLLPPQPLPPPLLPPMPTTPSVSRGLPPPRPLRSDKIMVPPGKLSIKVKPTSEVKLPMEVKLPLETKSASGIGKLITIENSDSGNGIWVCNYDESLRLALETLGGSYNKTKKCLVFSKKNKLAGLLEFFKNNAIPYINNTEIPISTSPALTAINKDTITIIEYGDGYLMCGTKTFPIKDDLKKMGGKWNATKKCWMVPVGPSTLLDYLADNNIKYQFVTGELPTSTPPLPISAPPLPRPISAPIANILLGEIHISSTETGKGIWVCGEATKNISDDLKTLKGKWNASKKCWVFTKKQLGEVVAYLNSKNIKFTNSVI